MDHTNNLANTMTLISFAVTTHLICIFVFAYAKIGFSHVAAQLCFRIFMCCKNFLFLSNTNRGFNAD